MHSLSSLFLSGCGILRTLGIYEPTAAEKVEEFKHDILAKKFAFELPPQCEMNRDICIVEAPDAIVPVEGSKQVLRYAENLFGAGVAYNRAYGIVELGFPFETILDTDLRHDVMRSILQYLSLLPQGS